MFCRSGFFRLREMCVKGHMLSFPEGGLYTQLKKRLHMVLIPGILKCQEQCDGEPPDQGLNNDSQWWFGRFSFGKPTSPGVERQG